MICTAVHPDLINDKATYKSSGPSKCFESEGKFTKIRFEEEETTILNVFLVLTYGLRKIR